jgi:acyl-CoA synthetase (AMP-forming)/AMP-acid ligase II
MAETTLMASGSVKAAIPTICQLHGAALEQNRIAPAQNQDNTRTLVGCGRTGLDQKVVIVDPESCMLCATDQVGEIWVSGGSVAQGYWNRPEQSQTTFRAYLADTGEGPFLRTGDLGFLREGELFITGRLKDVMIIRGQNHYPQDIELTLEKSHPALRPGCGAAFTVSMKGEERLVIVQEVERNYLRKLNVNEVVESIREAVAAEHGLQVYAAVLLKTGSIPKTSSGKIQRHACRTGFLAGSLNVVEDWSEHPQAKARFLHLQAEVESVLAKLTTGP